MDDNKPWTVEILISIALGVPIYILVGFSTPYSLWVACGIHGFILLCYFGLIRDFGRGSSIEVGVVFFITSALFSTLIPGYARSQASIKALELRHQQRAKDSKAKELMKHAQKPLR